MPLRNIGKKYVTNSLMELQIWDKVGVRDALFSKLQKVDDFLEFGLQENVPIR